MIIDIGEEVKDGNFKLVRKHRNTTAETSKRLFAKLFINLCSIPQGDTVALFAVPGCGEPDCDECAQDLPQLCEKGHHAGIGQDGFYAPYAAVHVRALAHVPAGVSPAEAAVATDAVATAYHAIHRRGQVKSTETVFLFGLGGLGFNALQVMLSIGARVLVSDLRGDLLREAAALGVRTEDIAPVGQSVQGFVEARGLHGKIDTVLDFVGRHQTFEDAQQIGKILLEYDKSSMWTAC